jgi:arylsulfatase A-like enzyme
MSRKHHSSRCRWSLRWLLVPLALLALAASACSRADRERDADAPAPASARREPATRPNVLLIVVDTLRADRVLPGRLPAESGTSSLTPFLDDLRGRGVTFGGAYSSTPWTSPAVATLFTSRYPLQHRVSRYDSKLAAEEVTLAERLRIDGYASAGFSANLYIQARLGYAQGFEAWHTYLGDPDGEIKPRAGALVERSLDWLASRARAGDQRPGFLYLQFLEPHSPYLPPEPYRAQTAPEASGHEVLEVNAALQSFRFKDIDDRAVDLLRLLYDGEVAFFDAALRRLFDALASTGFLDDAIVIVTSDHGEEFREHESLLHGLSLFEPAIRVPLLVIAPGVTGGQVIQQPVSILDIPATLLDLLGLPAEPRFEGRSLLPLMQPADRAGSAAAEAAPSREILLELAHRGGPSEVRQHAWGLIRGSQKLLIDPDENAWVYDLASDPDERSPRAANDHEEGPDLLAALEQLRGELTTRAGEGTSPAHLDAATRARLRALGYLGGAPRDGR